MAATPREALQRRGVAETKVASNGAVAPTREDPMDRAYEELRTVRAMEIEDTASEEIAARKAQARLERTKAEAATAELNAHLQELSAAARGGGQGNEVMLAIVQMLQGDKAALLDANKELGAQIGQIQQTIAAGLRADVATAKDADAMNVVTQNVATFKAMYEAVRGIMPEPAPSVAASVPAGSIQDQIALMRAEAEVKREGFEWEEQHARHLADYDLRRRELDHRLTMDREKHETDKRRVEGLASTLERMAPAAMSVFSDVARSRFGSTGAAVAEAATEALPSQHVKCDAVLDGGRVCGHVFEVPLGSETAACPACHVISNIRDT
jgi:hypothetical protein